jgi:hypothetical protein
MDCIPDRITSWLQPAAKSLLKFKQVRDMAIPCLFLPITSWVTIAVGIPY